MNKTRGERLKQARIKAGYGSRQLAAERLGMPLSTYASHENGQTDPPVSNVEAYARLFKTTPWWILFGIGETGIGIDAKLAGQPEALIAEVHILVDALIAHKGAQPASKLKAGS